MNIEKLIIIFLCQVFVIAIDQNVDLKDSKIIEISNSMPNSSLKIRSKNKNDDDDSLVPPANVRSQIAKISGTANQKAIAEFCPSLENADLLTDEEFFAHLVHPCRYDRIQRPRMYDDYGKRLPVNVYARFFIYYLQNLDTHELQFAMQTLVQMRYVDPRLSFKDIAPGRTIPIKGEEDLRNKIWVPHVFFSNEKESRVLGTYGRHILTSISPDGTVIISSRLQATLFCPMDLKKFPFDQQECRANLECWMYNSSQVQLHWEKKSPLTLGPDKILSEYVLTETFTNETKIVADEHDLRHGAFVGNYSSISFCFKVERQSGFYILEFFLPSILIVAISWVSFWLQADQTAPRAMLGATSMLSFITLSSAQNKILPKVSYIKASEIWSMGCNAFIFGSLVEFAFVNVIWRRKKHVELKKVNAANILKHTLTASEIRAVLGIDTSRSVNHSSNSKNETILEENENSIKGNDKRKSFDSFLKVSETNSKISSRRSSIKSDLESDMTNNNHNKETKISEVDKMNNINHSKTIKPHIEKRATFSESIPISDTNKKSEEETFRNQNDSKIHLARKDSSGHFHRFNELEHRRKSVMLPIIFTEDDNGEIKMEMDTSNVQVADDNDSIEIVMENENEFSHHHHHSIYEGWTRMTPQEISHYIDKRSRAFFPGAFLMFNILYWTFVYFF
ncbi:hypothetical protein PVAND_006666 [Polypedilum vanderplanki]|uniref:pH-sensitive chloride channel 2 n=1 Tax=Polypedilum vanderplanki TaxID=319348 RepID=A0A9J6C4W4_POLVA|nr:hypothetical protein PVAND_006666 [Polypedilum vanderplanki]